MKWAMNSGARRLERKLGSKRQLKNFGERSDDGIVLVKRKSRVRRRR